MVYRRSVLEDGDRHGLGVVLGDRVDRVRQQAFPELGVDPGPGDDAGAEGQARTITGCGFGGGDRRIDVVRVDVTVVVEMALEDLGALVGCQLAHTCSKSLSPRSAVTVWSAVVPKRSEAAKVTVYTNSGSPYVPVAADSPGLGQAKATRSIRPTCRRK